MNEKMNELLLVLGFRIYEEIYDVLSRHCLAAALCISFATYKSIPNISAVLSGVVFNSVSNSTPCSISESFNPSAISI